MGERRGVRVLRRAGVAADAVDPEPGDVAGLEAPVDLHVAAPVAEGLGRRGRTSGAASATEIAVHHLALDLDEREALEGGRRFPLPEAVDAVDSGPAFVAGAVRTERGRGADEQRLGVGEVERGGVARSEKEIREST